MILNNRCAVAGCMNDRRQGLFVGDVCGPCHQMITTGEVGCGDTFIHKLNRAANETKIACIDIPAGPGRGPYGDVQYRRVTATDVLKMLDQLAAIRVALNR